jgi:hypothetical protein
MHAYMLAGKDASMAFGGAHGGGLLSNVSGAAPWQTLRPGVSFSEE